MPLQRLLGIEYWQIFVKLTAVFALPYYLYLDFLDFGKFEIIWFGCSCDSDIWKKTVFANSWRQIFKTDIICLVNTCMKMSSLDHVQIL